MADRILERMVYSYRQPMWHNITEPSLVPMAAEEILDNRFGGGFAVETRPITLTLNGEPIETGDFGIVRGPTPEDPSEVVFGYCTDRYHLLQPRTVTQLFDQNVMEPAETMGFLGKGEEIFISWVMPTFEVVKDDPLDVYGIVKGGFDTNHSYRLFSSIYRPVCSNTLTLAEGWAEKNSDGKGRGMIWRGKGTNSNLERDLGYWLSHVQGNARRESELIKSLFSRFAQTPIVRDDDAKMIIEEAYPDMPELTKYYPKELRTKKEEAIASQNESQGRLRDGIFELFAGVGTAIDPSYYGLLNATTEYLNHYGPSKKAPYSSNMWGGRQKQAMQMVTTLDYLSR